MLIATENTPMLVPTENRRFLGFPLWRSFSRMRISLAVNTSASSMAVYNEAMFIFGAEMDYAAK